MANAAEGSHFGGPDFRVGGRIFATLSLEREGYGVLLLNPEQQAGMVLDEPEVFSLCREVGAGMDRRGCCSPRLPRTYSKRRCARRGRTGSRRTCVEAPGTARHLLLVNATGKEFHNMKVDYAGSLASFSVIALGLALSGCQQPAASTPPATTTVIEDVHRGQDDKGRKMQDRDHPPPDDRRDHPDDAPRR
jgi:hypothetical protein